MVQKKDGGKPTVKGKKQAKSLTLRLMLSLVLVLILLNLVSMISSLRLIATARKGILQEHSYLQSYYINQLDRELEQTQTRLYSMSRSYDFSMALSHASDSKGQYSALRSQVALKAQMKEWLTLFPMIDGYFIDQIEDGLLIISGDDTATTQVMTDYLRDNASDELLRAQSGQWQMYEAPSENLLVFVGVRRGTRYGAWVRTAQIMETWGLRQEEYQLLPSTAAPADGTVDAVSEQAQCLLRYCLPNETFLIPVNDKILLGLSMVMLLSIPFIWLMMRRLVLKPLHELMEAIGRIESGDTAYRIPEKSTSSEFDRLNAQFNRSVEQLTGMRMEVYEAQLENERTRVSYLTQQMQPHFVLNTLNLIYSMEPEEYDLIQSTIVCLSDYYRYVAHISEPLVPLGAELNHAENYFRLQQIRYPDTFSYTIDCPEALKEWMIPPIVIQTFAENTMKHSLIPGKQNSIVIRIEETREGQLHVLIRDSGHGYPETVLAQIHRYQETREKQADLGIGIQNTIERVRLIYKGRERIDFRNAPEGGAQVDFYFPAQEEKRHEAHRSVDLTLYADLHDSDGKIGGNRGSGD